MIFLLREEEYKQYYSEINRMAIELKFPPQLVRLRVLK